MPSPPPGKSLSNPDVNQVTLEGWDRNGDTLSVSVNLSPPGEVWIIGFRSGTEPAAAPDGVPNSYTTTHYGSADGSTAGADTDSDGFTTLEEFKMKTDPTDPASGLILTGVGDGSLTRLARRFDLYRIQSSADLTSGVWTTLRLSTQSESAPTVPQDRLPPVALCGFRGCSALPCAARGLTGVVKCNGDSFTCSIISLWNHELCGVLRNESAFPPEDFPIREPE